MLACTVVPAAAADDATSFDPATGYRIDRYRAPVLDTPAGVRRIETTEVEALPATRVPVFDVMPIRPGGWDRAIGRWLPAEPHVDIRGTH